MRKYAWLLAAVVAAGTVFNGSPGSADLPPFANYLRGTWSCVSASGSNIVKAYGTSPDGRALDLWNSYITTSGGVSNIFEEYSQNGPTVTVVSNIDRRGQMMAASTDFSGGTLVFSSTETFAGGTRMQRMTYTRVDQNNFTRKHANGLNAGGLTVTSSENCTRLSGPPVPSPKST